MLKLPHELLGNLKNSKKSIKISDMLQIKELVYEKAKYFTIAHKNSAILYSLKSPISFSLLKSS